MNFRYTIPYSIPYLTSFIKRVLLLFFAHFYLLNPQALHGQSEPYIIVKQEDRLSSILTQRMGKGVRIAFDHDITCQPVRPTPIKIYYDSEEEGLRKLGCYCRLDIQKLEDSTFLIRTTQSSDKFHVITLRESETHHIIPYALVKTYPDYGTFISDRGGEIYIRIKNDEKIEKIIIQSLTYGQQVIMWSDIKDSNLQLSPRPVQLSTITHRNTSLHPLYYTKGWTVFDKNNASPSIPYNQFTNTPGALAMLLPGQQMAQDKTSGKPIRSSEQAQMMLTIDGMPVYKTDHFFGIFSSVNPDFTEKITSHRNIIPVRFGSRSSQMMEYQSPDIVQRSQLLLHANLLYSGASTRIKISENAGLLLSGRYTYINLLQSSYFDAQQRLELFQSSLSPRINNTISSRPLFNFYDINAKAYVIHQRHKWTLSSFHSSDTFEDNQDLEIRTQTGTRTVNIFQRTEDWTNHTYMLHHAYKKQDFLWQTAIYKTHFSTNQNLNYRIRENQINLPTGVIQNFNNSNHISDTGIKTFIEKKVLKKSKIQFGSESVHHDNILEIAGQENPFFEYITSPWEHSLFGQLEYISDDYWLWRPAMRLTYVPGARRFFFQPQLYVQKFLSQDWKIKSSYAQMYSLMRQFIYETPTGLVREFFAFANGTSIPFGATNHVMTGIQYSDESSGWGVDVEFFYRHLDGAINYATRQLGIIRRDQSLGLNDFDLFIGQSRYYGSDINITYATENVRWINQYTLSQSEQKFSEIFNGTWHPSPQDSRHQYRSLLSYTSGSWVLSLAYSGASGLPYQDITKARTIGDRRLLTPENVISRLPDFHRWDAGVQFQLNIQSRIITMGAHIYNIFNRDNVTQRQFLSQLNANSTQILEIESDVLQLGRVFNLGISIQL